MTFARLFIEEKTCASVIARLLFTKTIAELVSPREVRMTAMLLRAIHV